jgi:hypothetical protein
MSAPPAPAVPAGGARRARRRPVLLLFLLLLAVGLAVFATLLAASERGTGSRRLASPFRLAHRLARELLAAAGDPGDDGDDGETDDYTDSGEERGDLLAAAGEGEGVAAGAPDGDDANATVSLSSPVPEPAAEAATAEQHKPHAGTGGRGGRWKKGKKGKRGGARGAAPPPPPATRPPHVSEAQWAEMQRVGRVTLLNKAAAAAATGDSGGGGGKGGGGGSGRVGFGTDFSDRPWSSRPNGGAVTLVTPTPPPVRTGPIAIPCRVVGDAPPAAAAHPAAPGGRHNGKRHGRALAAARSAPAGAVDEARRAVLCDARDEPVAWADVAAMCAAHGGVGSRPGSGLVMHAPVWAALRVAAYGALQANGSSSTFPVATTGLPWDMLRALRGPAGPTVALRHKLLLTPMFLMDGRFDVLLDATALCGRVLPDFAAPRPPVLTGRAVSRLLLTLPDHVRGVSAKATLKRSAFWAAAWAAGVDAAPSTAANVTWCGGAGAPGGDPAWAAAVVCDRQWLPVPVLRYGLRAMLARLYTGPVDVSLFNTGSMLKRLRGLGDSFKFHSNIFQGAKHGNSSLLNAGFNPPNTHSSAGVYATAYNVVVTPSGGLQTLPGTEHQKEATHEQLFHTTCERREDARVPASDIPGLPMYDEVVVLTHRIEANIYHWTAETVGKLAPILDYVLAHPHVRVHIMTLAAETPEPPFRAAHLAMLGLPFADRVVQGALRARVVHYPDNHGCRFPYGHWVMLLRERYRAAVGYNTPLRARDVASESINTREEGGSGGSGGAAGGEDEPASTALVATAGGGAVAPPRTIVVLRRKTARRITNEVTFLLALRALKASYNVTLVELADWRMPDQAAVFATIAGADVVVGAHGAGQTNNIVAPPGACLVEVMPTDWLVPCYWRMAGHLGLRYRMFMVKGDRTPPITIAVRAVVAAVRDCLDKSVGGGAAGTGGGGAAALAAPHR